MFVLLGLVVLPCSSSPLVRLSAAAEMLVDVHVHWLRVKTQQTPNMMLLPAALALYFKDQEKTAANVSNSGDSENFDSNLFIMTIWCFDVFGYGKVFAVNSELKCF